MRAGRRQVCVRGDVCEADLFVEEADGHRAERCARAPPTARRAFWGGRRAAPTGALHRGRRCGPRRRQRPSW